MLDCCLVSLWSDRILSPDSGDVSRNPSFFVRLVVIYAVFSAFKISSHEVICK